ncbi:hypothetical protein [Halovenus sp. HT40]|uniref:hypothetical protein n=1 Tax=Halovenus sp. HT40 TaxID=3126691 RepID=UPI00300EC3B7
MNSQKSRKIGALWAITQGLLTALVPQISVKLMKKMIGQNFENAAELEAKPGYLRQLRALGIGLAAAGIAGLVMENAAADPDESEADDSVTDSAEEDESA